MKNPFITPSTCVFALTHSLVCGEGGTAPQLWQKYTKKGYLKKTTRKEKSRSTLGGVVIFAVIPRTAPRPSEKLLSNNATWNVHYCWMLFFLGQAREIKVQRARGHNSHRTGLRAEGGGRGRWSAGFPLWSFLYCIPTEEKVYFTGLWDRNRHLLHKYRTLPTTRSVAKKATWEI